MSENTNNATTEVRRRRFTGTVVSDVNDKTIVVKVERQVRHPLYGKAMKRTKKFHVHDENNTYKVGDTVEFEETTPKSKKKRWSVVTNA